MPKRSFQVTTEGMPKDSILGNMPNFNRRTFLHGLGSTAAMAGVVAAPAVAEASAPAATPENEELRQLVQLLDDYLAGRAAANAEVDRIADEWRDRWPLAPEILLGPTVNGRPFDDNMWSAERDIAGKVLARDVSVLTKRLTKNQRAELSGQRKAFYVGKRSSLADTLTRRQDQKPSGRTPKALARNRVWRAKTIAQAQTQLDLAHRYEAETAQLREVSGMNGAKNRRAAAERNIASTREAISLVEARTPADLWMKAEVMRDELKESGLEMAPFVGSAFGRLHRLAFSMADAKTSHELAS
jgi:hypothetical protein